jgi:putative endonuclease
MLLLCVIPGRAAGANPESIIQGGAVVYYVYILASRKHGTLYIGVTSDLVRRVHEHKTYAVRGFTSRYKVHLLVWFECYDDFINAIVREKELKKVAARMEDQLNRAVQPGVGRSLFGNRKLS